MDFTEAVTFVTRLIFAELLNSNYEVLKQKQLPVVFFLGTNVNAFIVVFLIEDLSYESMP